MTATATYSFTASPTRSPVRRASDRLDNAFECYAQDHCDGDYLNAREYRDEGLTIGDEAFDMPAEDRDDWIEMQTYRFPESARYLISCAADFRVTELVRDEARRERVAA